jgi:FtsH-binding integral membrane protein
MRRTMLLLAAAIVLALGAAPAAFAQANDQLPLGAALIGAGMALVLGTRRRYQARHARR